MTRRSCVLAVCFCACVFLPPAKAQGSKQTIQAIRELGKGTTGSLPSLEKYLSDSDADVRIEATKAIVRIDTMRSIDPLLKAILDNDGEVQIRSIDGLVNAYVPGYVQQNSVSGLFTKGVRQVKGIFSSRNDTVVDSDVRVRPEIAAALAEKITGGNGMDVRADAALAAGILRAGGAVPALEQGLHSKDRDVIFESLVALQKIGDPAAGPAVDFLARDLDERSQLTALETLGVLRSLTSADEIRAAYKNARNVKVQRAALEALAMLGLSTDRPLFQQYLPSTDVDLRVAALEGLGRIREPDDFPAFKAAFEAPGADWRVHAAAAFAMVMDGDNSTDDLEPLPFLAEGFSLKQHSHISDAYIREVARSEQTRAALGKMLPDELKDRKIGILNALSGSGTPDVISIIQPYTNDPDKDIAFAASRALQKAQAHSS